jgi:D-proline reductase (dithiol) PrdB
VLIDSYRFLPRSFHAFYADAQPVEGEGDPVWAPFEKRLAEARIALVTSAGLSLAGEQAPFDLDRERAEPTWGDPSFRVMPHALGGREVAMSHLHVNNADVLADHNIALPTDVLDDVAADGVVGQAAPRHISVMGYQEGGARVWREETAPAIIELLRDDGVDGVVLAPI